ncbi:MAG: cytidylate kinase-like family protein [Clostridia bacterium]|nr:cytidylate kinase-like family protein [Clostridia bacterium]
MSKRVITISRQFGSGGHSIGKKLAERLGVPLYDNELVTKIAEKSGFDVSFIKENSEKTSRGTGFFLDYGIHGGAGFTTLSLYDQLYIAQHNIIRDLADQESCVIVGRCADYVLEDREDTLHVLIYADDDYRAERIVRLYGERDLPIAKRMKKKDSQRESYYRHYTNREWGDYKNYAVCLNTAQVDEDTCVDLIVNLFNK